jgi:hypothetical protein
MFTADDIQQRVRVRPFRPLRIVTSASETFDVYHPDLIMIGRRDLIVGLPSGENPAHYEQVARVAIMYVTALHDLPMPVPPAGNGQT